MQKAASGRTLSSGRLQPGVVRQTWILIKKNWILLKRSKLSSYGQLAAPVFFNLLILLLPIFFGVDQAAELNPVPNSANILLDAAIPRCVPPTFSETCVTLAYAPTTEPAVVGLMERVAVDQGIPPSEVVGYPTYQDLDADLLAKPNITQAAVVFNTTGELLDFSTNGTVAYALQFNVSIATCPLNGIAFLCKNYHYDWLSPYQTAIEKAIYANKTNTELSALDVTVGAYPMPRKALEELDGVEAFGVLFWFTSGLFLMVVQLIFIVSEKELRLRQALKTIGLADLAFWLSWFITNFLITNLSYVCLILSGIVIGFQFFTVNEFAVYGTLFFLFGLNVIAIAFFFSTFIGETKTAFYSGFMLWIFFLIGGPLGTFVLSLDPDQVEPWILTTVSLISPVLFQKGIQDLANRSVGEDAPGIAWDQIDDNGDGTQNFPMIDIYWWLIYDFALYIVLTWYVDAISPANGVPQGYLFFLKPSYYGLKSSSTDKINPNPPHRLFYEAGQIDGPEVGAERTRVINNDFPDGQPDVKFVNMSKVFFGRGSGWTAMMAAINPTPDKFVKGFAAVRNLSFHIKKNELFALLGHNGAGKSTAINMLTGNLPVTAGDAFVTGSSVVHQIDDIRLKIGLCPQFDILWERLNAEEHIRMFAELKGMTGAEIEKEVTDRLTEVDLLAASKRMAGGYSGGMRRRLSVAVALTGDPAVLVLDEPTTGMDPVSRQTIWKALEYQKTQRAIILTTHSMEEADILGDTIGIMAKGQLRALGTSVGLKSLYGAGYRMHVLHAGAKDSTANAATIADLLRSTIGADKMSVISQTSGVVSISIARSETPRLPAVFETLESKMGELSISDYSVSMTTLEEVFLSITHHYEQMGGGITAVKYQDMLSAYDTSMKHPPIALRAPSPAIDAKPEK